MSHVAARSLFLFDLLFLQVDRERDVCHSVVGKSGSSSQVRDVLYMCRSHNAFVKNGDIHEELVESDILLSQRANEIVKLKSGDRQYWLVIELGIVQTIQKMNPAWPRCGKTDAEFAGELCVTTRHKSSCFFVTHLNETNFLCVSAKGFHDAVYAIPGKPKNNFHAPIQQSFH